MPSITTWNRLEPRSRSVDLMEGLEARVHDPLWFLTRQWQVGEFEARNTGSPVTTSVNYNVAPFDRFSLNGQPRVYDSLKPIEVQIEQEPIRPDLATSDFRQAAEAGLYFARLLNARLSPSSSGAILPLYLAQYPLIVSSGDAQTISSIVAGRVIDGIKLHKDLTAAGTNLPPVPAIPASEHDAVLGATREWLSWYSSLFNEPAASGSPQAAGWDPDRMEYSFALGVAGGAGSYSAHEYDGGAVDWFTFNTSSNPIAGTTTATPPKTLSVTATPVTFKGMPARRFWEMEDASTDIGDLSAAAEDLGRLLLREFALIYGNDWFQFPLTCQIGSEVQITSLTVVDTFGVPTTIPHYSAVDGISGGWRIFSPSAGSGTPPSTSPVPQPIILTPGAIAPIDGAPIEEILLLRDELSNMVWGIERTVPGASGKPLDRATSWNTSLTIVPPPAAETMPQYRLGSNVPDYWIPFAPVEPVPPDGSSSVKLQRLQLPTSTTGALASLLKEMDSGFLLAEVPREGVLLERRYRFARGVDGSAVLWIGRQRWIGEGEGRSGLEFDFLE
jgi:hypothetical protein